MAKALKNYETRITRIFVEKVVETVVLEPVDKVENVQTGIELTLTQEEAQWLFDITGRTSGCPTLSRRKYSDSIRAALYGVGFKYHGGVEDIEQGLAMSKTLAG